MVIYSEKFFKFFMINEKFIGITLFPFIISRKKHLLGNSVFIQHEKIHIEQQKECLVLMFFVWYILSYIHNYVKYYGDVDKAYRNIPFEKEAYGNEDKKDYLKTRKRYNWLKL